MIKLNEEILSINSIQLNKKCILSANIQERENFYSFPKHTHRTVEIYFFINGSCKMDIGKDTILAESGNIIIILPNVVHSFYLDSKDKTKFIHIHFEPNELNFYFTIDDKTKIDLISFLCSIKYYYKLNSNDNLNLLLYSILEEKECTDTISKTLCNVHLIELLLYIIKNNNSALFSLHSKTQTTSSYVLFALEYIKEHYSEKILVTTISKNLNISSRYLSKLFYEETNLTIIQYLNIYRINTSINLMLTTNQSLTDIALNVGAGDIQHFSKLFKKFTGINPRNYKQLLLDLK